MVNCHRAWAIKQTAFRVWDTKSKLPLFPSFCNFRLLSELLFIYSFIIIFIIPPIVLQIVASPNSIRNIMLKTLVKFHGSSQWLWSDWLWTVHSSSLNVVSAFMSRLDKKLLNKGIKMFEVDILTFPRPDSFLLMTFWWDVFVSKPKSTSHIIICYVISCFISFICNDSCLNRAPVQTNKKVIYLCKKRFRISNASPLCILSCPFVNLFQLCLEILCIVKNNLLLLLPPFFFTSVYQTNLRC